MSDNPPFIDKSPAPFSQERTVVKTVAFPKFMSVELMDVWGDEIPAFSEADPTHPEWRATPIIPLDLSSRGFGVVYIKNEADRTSNPTGTIKDRAAWELATLYRDYARALYLKIRGGTLQKGELDRQVIPRLSLMTAGNEGRAIAACFEKYKLPPPKMIVGNDVKKSILDELRKLRADIYVVDLSKELSPENIKALSDNEGGIDITSVRVIEPESVFYDWHVYEVFNENPDHVYVPYGSGRLMENYLTWQMRSARNDSEGKRDPRLKAPVAKVISINVFGAEPEAYPSIADKLSFPFKPFLIFKDQDTRALVSLSFTGKDTSRQKVAEEYIQEGLKIFTEYNIDAEPSAAAGLGLYMHRFERRLVDRRSKVLIVNTGKGLT